MPREAFTDWEPKSEINKALLVASLRVIDEYAGQGYRLTLCQLYYQLVARDLIPNGELQRPHASKFLDQEKKTER